MTKKIQVRAPYIDPVTKKESEGLLMTFYVEDKNDIVTRSVSNLEKKDLVVEHIHAVQLFTTLEPDNDDEKGVTGAPSIFLVTIHKDSTLKGKKFGSDNVKRPWKLIREDAKGQLEVVRFRPTLELSLELRSPLLWAQREKRPSPNQGYRQIDEAKVGMKFTFVDVSALPGKPQSNKNKCVKFKGDPFEMERRVNTGFDLQDLFAKPLSGHSENLPTGTWRRDDRDFFWAPKLFLFNEFNMGSPPFGSHFYAMRFVPIQTENNKPRRYGLSFRYNCVVCDDEPSSGPNSGWGTDEATASRLWPLGIAPLGHYRTARQLLSEAKDWHNRLGDVYATQLFSPEPVIAQIDAVSWRLDLNYVCSKEVAAVPVSPFGVWNRQIADRYSQSLNTAKSYDPASILPRFDADIFDAVTSNNEKVEWQVRYILTDHTPHWPEVEDMQGVDDLEWITFEQLTVELDKKFAFGPGRPGFELNSVEEQPAVSVMVQIPNFKTTGGAPLLRRLQFKRQEYLQPPATLVHEAVGPPELAPAGFTLQVHDAVNDNPPQGSAPARSRVGALDLYFLPEGEKHEEDSKTRDFITAIFEGVGRLVKGELSPPDSYPARPFHPAIEANIILQLSAFGVGGQDPIPTEATRPQDRRTSTVIVPVDVDKDRLSGGFLLVVKEQASRTVSHSLTMRLERGGVGGGNTPAVNEEGVEEGVPDFDLIIVDTEPFLITRVSASMDLALADEIGNWTGDDPGGASWELKDLGGGFDLKIPPQTVGEEFIRNYDEPDQEPDKPLNYKFSPPGAFRLSRTPFKQSFSEAPWNLRRLLGYPGQRQPGMGVFSLTFELLYGLTTTITTDPRDLNLTELNALIGRPPAPLDPNAPWNVESKRGARDEKDFLEEAYQRYSRAYDSNLIQIRTRLALLLPRLSNQKTPFLTLRDGVGYRFRESRQSQSPFERFDPNDTRRLLRGGVDWGFTSQNIHEEVKERPSTAGLITNPSFTALGGNGFQKAVFAGGKSTIYSDTFLGRTFFYSLERIGRIGMLWNTAKHVIIFERSVINSQQFPDPERKWQGRPVVRKVREYVEILQPERAYPEFGEAPVVRGFARGSKFPQTVINIDSAWGRDVPGGWIVPLHNPAADSLVYPKPQVLLKLTTSDKQAALPIETKVLAPAAKPEEPFVWGAILNPEDLVFYTSTNRDDDPNTDKWAPALGVDFPFANLPTNDDDIPKTADDKEDPDNSWARIVPPGYERFSLRVNTGGTPVNLLAERVSAVSDAVVENIILVRRNLETVGQTVANEAQQKIDQALAQGKEIEKALQEDIQEALSLVRNVRANLSEIRKKVGDLGKDALNQLAAVEDQYKKIPNHTVDALINQAHTAIRNTWLARLAALRERVSDEAEGVIRRTEAETTDRKREVEELIRVYEQHIKREATTLLDQFKQSVEHAAALLKALAEALDNGATGAEGEIKAAIAREIDLVKDGLTVGEEKIQNYRRHMLSIISSVESKIAAVNAVLATTDPTLVKAVEDEFKDLAAKLLPALDKFPLKQETIDDIDDAVTRLQDEIKKLADNIGLGDATAAFKEIRSKLKDLDDEREKLLTAVTVILEEKFSKMTALDQDVLLAISDAETAMRNAAGRIFEKAEQYSAALQGEMARGLGKFDRIKADVEHRVKHAKDLAKNIIDGLEDLEKLPDEIQRQLRGSLHDLVQQAIGPVRAAIAPYEQMAKELEKMNVSALAESLAKSATLPKIGDSTLRLVRAHGLAPIGQAIDLDKQRIAYYFNEQLRNAQNELTGTIRQLENAVDITPAKVLVNRARDLAHKDLKSLGIELPARRIAEKFRADINRLRNLKLRDVLPDFAGINLEQLFSTAGFPLTQSETVRITHGIDPSTYRPWAQCDVNLAMPEDADVFNVASVIITLQGAKFTAHTRISVDEAGGMKREVKASIFANWRLAVAGQRIMTIKNSTLHFDDTGKIRFDMGANDVELAEVLRFVTDLLSSLKVSNKSGLSFEVLTEGVLPIGARASLNLAMPPLQTGAFSMSNLTLGALFELGFKGGEFYLAIGLGLSTRERPFNLSILCLGGGGWLTVKAIYKPGAAVDKISALLSIGISAGASLPFDIGVASGGIYFFVGLGVEYTFKGGGGSLTMLLRISIVGELVILGIISVGVLIALEARYGDGALVCTGVLRVSIKICWCFTLRVNAGFSVTLAGSSPQSGGDMVSGAGIGDLPEVRVPRAVKNYIASFGG